MVSSRSIQTTQFGFEPGLTQARRGTHSLASNASRFGDASGYYAYNPQSQAVSNPYQPAVLAQTQPISQPVSQPTQQLTQPKFSPNIPDRVVDSTPANQAIARKLGLMDYIRHPIATFQLKARLKENPQAIEPMPKRMGMYLTLQDNLSSAGKMRLRRLLNSGRLTRYNGSQDGRNTLAHLYTILTTPRAQDKYGHRIDPTNVVEDFLRLSDRIETITQPFQPLTDQNAHELLDYYNNDPTSPYFNHQLTREEIEVAHSATCVSASLMASMVGEHADMANRPDVDHLAEFTRHLEGLTSQKRSFTKKVSREVLCPSDPSRAEEVIDGYGLVAKPLNNQEFMITVDLPEDAVIRAINAQEQYRPGRRGVTEAVAQSAYTHLVDPNYVPGLDHRVTDGNIEDIPGIEADRKQLLESIAVGEPIMSIQYQFTAVDRPDSQPYLIGYTRSLNETQNDILTSLKMGKKPIVGVVWTDESGPSQGRIPGGHEFLIVNAQQKPDGWYFKIFDSDDGQPHAVWRSARDIIPRIHHVGLPLSLAKRVQQQIEQLGDNQYLVPDQSDAAQFDLIKTLPLPKHQQFLAAYEQLLAQDEQPAAPATQNTTQATQQPAYNPYQAYTPQAYTQQAYVNNQALPTAYGTPMTYIPVATPTYTTMPQNPYWPTASYVPSAAYLPVPMTTPMTPNMPIAQAYTDYYPTNVPYSPYSMVA